MPAPSASRATARQRDHRPALLALLPARGARARAARPRARRSPARVGAFEDEGWRVRKDGSLFWANVVITAMRDSARQAARLRQGHARPDASDATTKRRCARARSASGCSSKASPTTPSSCSTPTAGSRPGTSAPSASRATRPARSSGRHFSIFYPQEARGQRLARARAARSPPRTAASSTTAGACARTARCSGPTSRSPRCATRTGRLLGFAKLTRDLTESKRIEAIELAGQQREELLRGRAQRAHGGAARDPHQGRIPRHAVARAAHAAERDPRLDADPAARPGRDEPAASTRAVEVIDRNARAQVQLIDDLLDLSRIMTGKIRLDLRQVSLLGDRAGARSSRPSPSRRAKDIRLHEHPRPVARRSVSGDRARLQQVVWNLLTNAIKFTPKGGQVQVLLQRVNSHVELSVSDTGIGIPANFLPQVFERFSQRDSSTTRAMAASGLGLAISKQLVELHGGTIRVASRRRGHGRDVLRRAADLDRAGRRTSARAPHPTQSNESGESVELRAAQAGRRARLRRRRRAGRARAAASACSRTRAPR